MRAIHKGPFVERQCCNKCGWFEKPSGLPVPPSMRVCCPSCGNGQINKVIGRYVIKARTRGIWPLAWREERYTEFEKA